MKRLLQIISLTLLLALILPPATTRVVSAAGLTVDVQIAASPDDGSCDDGNNFPTNVYAECATAWVKTGLRWAINIPAGATVLSANITVKAADNDSGTYNGKIELFDSDNATDFSSSFWNRAVYTSAGNVTWDYVDWTVNEWYTSPEIKTLVQAFIDRPGYSPGNYLGLRITGLNEVSDWRAFLTYDSGSGNAAWLHIQYAVPPTVITQAASSVEETTATLNGNITDIGGENCDERGFDWDIDSGAPYANNWTESGSYETGAFTKGITSLSPGTTYYYRAKAHNSADWGYGGEQSFTTKPNPPTGLSDTGRTATSISLSWTKGSGAEKTMIRYRTDQYPTGTSDGTQA